MPDAEMSPPLPLKAASLLPPPEMLEANNALGEIKFPMGKEGTIPSSLAEEDEKFLNSSDSATVPTDSGYDVDEKKPGSVKMAELAGIERKFMEMKAERQKSLRDVQESGDKGV